MEIELKDCNNNVVGKALVSPDDYDKVKKYSWSKWSKTLKYGEQTYAKGMVNGHSILMHQFIMGKPPSKELIIDHKNHNGLDNRRQNLRFATYGDNAQNREKIIKENTSSQYIGVSKNRSNKFQVRYGTIYLASFNDEIEAAKHYDKYVIIKHNDACMLNFPDNPPTVDGIKLEDLIVNKKKFSDLPNNIYIDKRRSKYYAQKCFQGKLYWLGYTSTVDEAVNELEKINKEIKQIQNMVVKEHFEKPIKRNSNNDAVIYIHNHENDLFDECIVDDEFWHELTLSTWWLSHGYAHATISKENVSMHSFIVKKTQTSVDMIGDVIDHINNNRLDNRMANLRNVNSGVNNHNIKKKEGCSSSYIGVSKAGKKWQADISFNGTRERLGTHKTEIDAARVYNKRAKELYKENARLNIIVEDA